jgi:pyrimidine operon attenuation protein/uracil phosphoribosyltransferase
MVPDLTTTNVLLGVMAAVSLLEALAVIGLLVGGVLFYRRLQEVLSGLEDRQVAPVASRVNAILDDISSVTMRVKGEADRFDRFVRWGIDSLRRYRRGHAPRPS